MSNMGFEKFLESIDRKLHRTPVGDRSVSSYMRQHNLNVGGEQSGHIILGDYSTTGDGLIAALQVLAVIVASGKPTSEVCHLFDPYPQVLKNFRIEDENPLDNLKFQSYLAELQQKVKNEIRLLIRKSGTEPVLRVMAEGKNKKYLDTVINDIMQEMQKSA